MKIKFGLQVKRTSIKHGLEITLKEEKSRQNITMQGGTVEKEYIFA